MIHTQTLPITDWTPYYDEMKLSRLRVRKWILLIEDLSLEEALEAQQKKVQEIDLWYNTNHYLTRDEIAREKDALYEELNMINVLVHTLKG